MEVVHAAGVTPPPALLVSLHDVSPLTLESSQAAVRLLEDLGVSPAHLSVFVIPFHEGKTPVDQHPPTVAFLRGLADRGARLVMHGLTHRMTGRAWTPAGLLRAHVFARGQGELYRCTAADAEARIDQGRDILARAGLSGAARAFVPPAWLLSAAAHTVVASAGFEFFELFSGIIYRQRRLARRVIGWGSLGELEARATALYADLQHRLPPADTRLAVHPVDVTRASQRRAIARVVGRLLPRLRPLSYTDYLAQTG
jgi:predicted deacetylase